MIGKARTFSMAGRGGEVDGLVFDVALQNFIIVAVIELVFDSGHDAPRLAFGGHGSK